MGLKLRVVGLAVSVVTGALASGVGALPASAVADIVSDQLIIRGNATTTPPVQFKGGSGTFTFTPTMCKIKSDVPTFNEWDPPDPAIPPLADTLLTDCTALTVRGGLYSNGYCGQGVATGTATVQEGLGANLETSNITFWILFAPNLTGKLSGSGTESDSGIITLDGEVSITPVQTPDPTSNYCTTDFTVEGAATTWEN